MNGDVVSFKVEGLASGLALSKLSGIWFKESKLVITTETDDMKMAVTLTIEEKEEFMKQWILSRYRAEMNLLDLSQLKSDVRLKESGCVQPDLSTNMFVQSLLKAARDICPNVASISFIRNHIGNLSALQQLATYLPHIQNLNFDHNNLSQLESLDYLMGLTGLTELIFINNPIYYRNRTAEQKNHYRRLDIYYERITTRPHRCPYMVLL